MKLLMLSDMIMGPTGFANQTRELASRLNTRPDFEAISISWNYQGQAVQQATLHGGETINTQILPGGRAAYAQNELQEYLKNEQPDLFWTLLDSFMLFPWILTKSFNPAKSLLYYPSDGEYFPKQCEKVLMKYDNTVAMSRFGQEQVHGLFNIKSHYIPHATDPNTFHPLPPGLKEQCKQKFGIPANAFVFGDVARNQGRKAMAYEIIAFAKFLEENPHADAYLLLHTDFQDIAAPSDLNNLAHRYNVQHRVKPTGMKSSKGFPKKEMNNIYNAMDVRISTSTGEGFGICSIESMSAGIPNINVDYTTTPELYDYPWPEITNGRFHFKKRKELQIGKAGIGVPIATEVPGTWDVYRGFVDENKFAEAMTLLYQDNTLKEKIARSSRKRVQKYYSWDGPNGIFQQWVDHLQNVIQ